MRSVTLRDGARMAYDIYDFTDPWEDKETIVLTHGFSKNRKFWYAWIPALARRYQTIRVDLRGHGESSMPPENFEMSLDPFAADLNEFLDQLGIASAHFCMAEFASSLAVVFANQYPSRLRSLILPGFGYNWTCSLVDIGDWIKLIKKEGSETWARATVDVRLPADADPLLKQWYVKQQGLVPSWLLVKVFEYVKTVDLTDQLSQIQVPTLILAGENSKQEPLDIIKRGAELIPNSELTIIENVPLNVMNGAPEKCIATTIEFLERHTPPLTHKT